MTEIRKLRHSDDLFAVSRVYEESWKAAYKGLLPQEYLDHLPAGKWVPLLRQPGRDSLILLENDTVIGVSSYCASRTPELSGWGEIISLYLLPSRWGMGYGRQLFSAVIKQLEAAGYKNLFLWVLENNQKARHFYEQMGFHPYTTYLDDAIGGMPVREIQYRRNMSKDTNIPAMRRDTP